jgi:Flp pilus assembly protein TadG
MWRIVLRLIRKSAADRSGSVAIIFALTTIVVMSLVGGAIDYGRAVHARYQIQEAIDSAVLAAGRVWQVTGDISLAELKAHAHYAENKPAQMISQVSSFTPDLATRSISMSASGSVSTPFLSIIRIFSYQVVAEARAQLKAGGNDNKPIEVAMMLDTNRAMTGGALKALQDGATQFVEMILRGDNGDGRTRIALAPYAEGVRPGSPYFERAVGASPSQVKFEDVNGQGQTYRKTACTAERVGNQSFTAAAPTGSDQLIPIYTKTGQCTPDSSNAVTPLTHDREVLKREISELRAAGLNGGHIGVGWTWYLLSPDWAGIWPSASAPRGYNDVKKVAILMTSGAWEVAYDASGVATRDSGRNPNNGASDTYSRQLCDNMKAAGIIVYTVGYGLNERRAIENMRDCATDSSKFYDAQNDIALILAYQDIAYRIGSLRLVD